MLFEGLYLKNGEGNLWFVQNIKQTKLHDLFVVLSKNL